MKKIRAGLPVLVIAVGLIPLMAAGQSVTDRDKIAASQAGASPVYFDFLSSEVPLVQPGDFYNIIECKVRSGIPNFLEKVNSGKDVVVAFIGGSITQSHFGYRLQTANYLRNRYPKARFKWINAGVSGTGTELGAFRIQEQVLQHRPDLIFIEFAVNGAYPDGMEGMIRQAIRQDPSVDICLLYTILTGQTSFYQKNELPDNIKGLERVAAYYSLPSVQLGIEAAALEASGKLIWKAGSEQHPGKIIFAEDGIHPATAGGNLYAAAIARSLAKLETQQEVKKRPLPLPLITASWDQATMLEPASIARFSKGWQPMATYQNPGLKKFEGWFADVFTASAPGASFSFRFSGDMVGVFDIGGPEVGQLEWIIDGKPVQLKRDKQGSFIYYRAQTTDSIGATPLNRFNAYCNNRYRGQFDVIELPYGAHQVEVRVSGQKADKEQILPIDKRDDINHHPQKYDQSVIYLGRILIRGTLLQ